MIWKIIGSTIGVVSFSIILELPKKYLVYAGIIGAVGGWAYFFFTGIGHGDVVASFFGTILVAVLSHVWARMLKVPVPLFIIAGILPMVPGAGMYKIVYNLIINEPDMTEFYLIQTVEVAGAIALGMFIVDTIFKLISRYGKSN